MGEDGDISLTAIQGSIGNLASAATVAASSFEMKLKDPHEFLETIDLERWHTLRGFSVSATDSTQDHISYMEPSGSATAETKNVGPTDVKLEVDTSETADSSSSDVMTGKVQRLGDFIDTDAVCCSHSSKPRHSS